MLVADTANRDPTAYTVHNRGDILKVHFRMPLPLPLPVNKTTHSLFVDSFIYYCPLSLQNLAQIEPSLVIDSTDATKATSSLPNGVHPKSSLEAACPPSSSKISIEYKKLRQLLNYEEAPKYLQFNSFIKSGYRNILPTRLCIESIFWWTNETVNIWSHIFGWFLFLALGWADYTFLRDYGSTQDKVVAAILIVCFQVCMVMSSVYHTFSCRSEKDYDCFLAFDLFGIALSLIAIYISGIYYAFWCQDVSEGERDET